MGDGADTEGEFACVAVFEFDAVEEADRVERVELYRGSERECEYLAANLTKRRERGIDYREVVRRFRPDAPAREIPPIHAVAAVCSVASLEAAGA